MTSLISLTLLSNMLYYWELPVVVSVNDPASDPFYLDMVTNLMIILTAASMEVRWPIASSNSMVTHCSHSIYYLL